MLTGAAVRGTTNGIRNGARQANKSYRWQRLPGGSSPLAARGAIALSEAAREPFVMYPWDKVPVAILRCQFSGFAPRMAQEALQVQTIMSLVASGLGVGLVAGVARRAVPRGVKCRTLTDNPSGFHVGIALARLAGGTSRLVERFAEHAIQFVRAQRDPGDG